VRPVLVKGERRINAGVPVKEKKGKKREGMDPNRPPRLVTGRERGRESLGRLLKKKRKVKPQEGGGFSPFREEKGKKKLLLFSQEKGKVEKKGTERTHRCRAWEKGGGEK